MLSFNIIFSEQNCPLLILLKLSVFSFLQVIPLGDSFWCIIPYQTNLLFNYMQHSHSIFCMGCLKPMTHKTCRLMVFYKIVILKSLTKVTRNPTYRSTFSIKKRLWYRCFPVNFAKHWKAPFVKNTSNGLLLHPESVLISLPKNHRNPNDPLNLRMVFNIGNFSLSWSFTKTRL